MVMIHYRSEAVEHAGAGENRSEGRGNPELGINEWFGITSILVG